MGIFQKLFGTRSERAVKQVMSLADAVMAMEDEYAALSDEQLQSKTNHFKERLQNGATLDDILPQAFATVREAAWRVLGMKHYKVQVIGGIILHQGRIAEMKTGEGKTLVATLPVYLNALTGKGVHVVTVNDYLARRDSEWMGKIYRFLGLSVGLVVPGMMPEEKQQSYACDITYGTGNEFGFDYLRDNMVVDAASLVQRGHHFAIVDEVDSILIDEARTPLIISGMGSKSTDLYERAELFVKTLRPFKKVSTVSKVDYDALAGQEYDEMTMSEYLTEQEHKVLQNADYIIDEKSKQVALTAKGVTKAEAAFHVENLADPENMTLSHHINQAMRAHGLMKRDIDYVVKDGQVLIVDEFTGRIMKGRRYNQGLHQAIEAKEHVTVERESKTLASITLQNYFRMYQKLSGMTGTALTEEVEFESIYSLDVVEIPSNKPNIRKDLPDVMYQTRRAKFDAVVEQIIACHEKGQPVLVGTISIEMSEQLSAILKKRGITHNVLNAKHHEKEALIVAQAGHYGAVTIATNMAGRGTDIKLGGNAEFMAEEELRSRGVEAHIIAEATGFAETDDPDILQARAEYQNLLAKHKIAVDAEAEKVVAVGGLYIIGTERHESRRIDNQLRGRAGRQGDPGTTQFYLSAEDDLLRLFAGDRMKATMAALKVPEDMPLESSLFSSTVEKSQARVESMHFTSRKHVLEYDNVINKQREIIYDQRSKVLANDNVRESILKMIPDVVAAVAEPYLQGEDPQMWDIEALQKDAAFLLQGTVLPTDSDTVYKMEAGEFIDMITERAVELYEQKEQEYPEFIREAERSILLRSVDANWMQHIDELDDLKQSIGLVSYGQKDPIVEYRIQSFDLFDQMIAQIKFDTVMHMLGLVIKSEAEIRREQLMKETGTNSADGEPQKKAPAKVGKKIGPNDPCPCGSGKKYKKCCGQR